MRYTAVVHIPSLRSQEKCPCRAGAGMTKVPVLYGGAVARSGMHPPSLGVLPRLVRIKHGTRKTVRLISPLRIALMRIEGRRDRGNSMKIGRAGAVSAAEPWTP